MNATVNMTKAGQAVEEIDDDFYGEEMAQKLVRFDFSSWLKSKGMDVKSTLDDENESLLKVSASEYFAMPRNPVIDNSGKGNVKFSQEI